ncbi:MAG TPA: hypothetical protein EYN66_11305 [Myxococcales bacterium]|nr:hypothetical protein [Myxococcales bacterium]
MLDDTQKPLPDVTAVDFQEPGNECQFDSDCGEVGDCIPVLWCDNGYCDRKFAPAGSDCGSGCQTGGQCTEDGSCAGTVVIDCAESDGNPCTFPECDPANGECVEVMIADGESPYTANDCFEGVVCYGKESDTSQASSSAMALECAAMSEQLKPFGCVSSYVCVGGAEKCKEVFKTDGVQCWPDDAETGCQGHACAEGQCVVETAMDEECDDADYPPDCDESCRLCTQLSCHWVDDPANPDNPTKRVRYCQPKALITEPCDTDPCLVEQACGLAGQSEGPLGKETLGGCAGGEAKTQAACIAELGFGAFSCVEFAVHCDSANGGCGIDQDKANQFCFPPGDPCFDKSATYCTHLDPGGNWDSVTGCLVSWIALDCEDNNECTIDSCKSKNSVLSCVHQNVSGSVCNDGNPCTHGETCSEGQCKGGAAKCKDNDLNPCTEVQCDGLTGKCGPANTTGQPCEDGNICTQTAQCLNNQCTVVEKQSCQDNNPCTDDLCDPNQGGCTNPPNTNPCSDGDASTVGDTCKDGKCVPGTPINCDDNEPCTDDEPDILKGCKHTNNTASCTDNDVCTLNDTCSAGKCISGATKQCDDGEFCTFDYCHPVTGCEIKNVSDGNSCPDFAKGTCVSGECTCQPICDGGTCGGDGCGGLCTCAAGSVCTEGLCKGVSGCSNCPANAFCVQNECTVPNYNGQWKVVASPSTKLVCGIANATYLPLQLTLEVTGTLASTTAQIAGFTLNYVGNQLAKHIKLVTQYTESGLLGDVVHTSVIEADFDSATSFDGTDTDSFEMPFIGPCSIIWVIHGEKL